MVQLIAMGGGVEGTYACTYVVPAIKVFAAVFTLRCFDDLLLVAGGYLPQSCLQMHSIVSANDSWWIIKTFSQVFGDSKWTNPSTIKLSPFSRFPCEVLLENCRAYWVNIRICRVLTIICLLRFSCAATIFFPEWLFLASAILFIAGIKDTLTSGLTSALLASRKSAQREWNHGEMCCRHTRRKGCWLVVDCD